MSLDSLRKLRAQTVEALMMELAQITQALVRNEEQYQAIANRIRVDSESYRQQAEQGFTIEVLLEWQGRLDSQQTALRHARCEIDQATLAWQRTKALLVEASQEQKLLDLVAEKRQDTHRIEANRQEQGATDSAASRRYVAEKSSRS